MIVRMLNYFYYIIFNSKNAQPVSHYWLGLGRKLIYGNSSDTESSYKKTEVVDHGRKLQPIDSVPPTIALTSM